jgi:hypothetical protein
MDSKDERVAVVTYNSVLDRANAVSSRAASYEARNEYALARRW